MSDFHQHGLICTLQRLTRETGEIESRLCALARENPISLVLPCHYPDLGKPALDHILDELDGAQFLGEVIVSMNGMDRAGFEKARKYFSRLRQPHRILWNDGPRMGAFYQQLADACPGSVTHGKGFNVWAGFGLVYGEGKSALVVTQDCDVASFRRGELARLCYACLEPALGYEFAKMYYSRVTDRIYGRVSRLFLAPLLQALVRVVGHHPLLDFLLSFRYPLSGECAMRRELAGSVSLGADWGLEIGLLCETFRAVEPARVCQVDGGDNYDHRHQPLGADANEGLRKMCRQIAGTLFVHLASEGVPMGPEFLPAVQSSYSRESREALRRYRGLALMNGIAFDPEAEQQAVEAFSSALAEAAGEGTDRAALQPWKRIAAMVPDLRQRFLAAVAEENQ